MRDLSARVRHTELLDEGRLSDQEARETFLDLRRVNRLFGARRLLLCTLAKQVIRHGLTQFSVLDVASGSCDFPMAILNWARRRNWKAHVFALEYRHRYLALFRHELAGYPELYPFCADAFRAPVLDQSFDFVTCSHFLHHLPDEQAAMLLSSMSAWARHAVIVADLERHWVPYYFFRLFSASFTASRVSRADGLTSLEQSFRKEELARSAERAGLVAYTVERRWPFQLLLVSEK